MFYIDRAWHKNDASIHSAFNYFIHKCKCTVLFMKHYDDDKALSHRIYRLCNLLLNLKYV